MKKSILLLISLLIVCLVGCNKAPQEGSTPTATPSSANSEGQDNNNKSNDYTKGYTTEVKDGSIFLTYNNSGNTVEIYNPKTSTIHKNDGHGEFTFLAGESQSSNAIKVYKNPEHRLYFEANENAKNILPSAVLYIDMETSNIFFVGIGELEYCLETDPLTNWTILKDDKVYNVYDNNNLFKCTLNYLDKELPLQVLNEVSKSESTDSDKTTIELKPETINDTYIDYSKYKAVVIPYNDTINKDNLTNVSYDFSDNTSHSHCFSVIGEISDVKIVYQENMDSDPTEKSIDKITNSYVQLNVPAGSDFSNIKVTAKIALNNGNTKEISFTYDDVSDIDPVIFTVGIDE